MSSFGELVKAVATRERAKSETLDHFGDLCVIEERATALREVIPRKDWTPPGRGNVGIPSSRDGEAEPRPSAVPQGAGRHPPVGGE